MAGRCFINDAQLLRIADNISGFLKVIRMLSVVL